MPCARVKYAPSIPHCNPMMNTNPQITNAEDTKKFLATAALDPFPGSPESMAALLRTELERWKGFVKLAKIEPM